MIVRLGVKDPP